MSRSLPKVVRVIAVVEAIKGLLALALGFGLLGLVHRNVAAAAAAILRFTPFDPAGRYPRALLDAARGVTDPQLMLLGALALIYATIRGAEAYWLWQSQFWAEWFALGSAAFYLPFEIYELTQGVTWLLLGVLLVNVAIVAYLAHTLRHGPAWPPLARVSRFAPDCAPASPGDSA